MRAFACEQCGQWLDFSSFQCVRCRTRYGFAPSEGRLERLGATNLGRCANAEPAACNWLVEAATESAFCVACRLNRTIPNLDVPGNPAKWRRIEEAKRRLVYSLLRLRLGFRNRTEDPEAGLAFDFLSEEGAVGPVRTGHLQGIVTLNVAEADDVERERIRTELQEPYRTLLGHFRHEVGHYFWDRLILGSERIEEFRRLFGDERVDYGQALERRHAEGPPATWSESFVTAYASAHAWEDWAETWAHYLHIVDALETAYAYQLNPQSREPGAAEMARIDFDPYREDRFNEMLAAMVPLGFAANSLARSLGHADAYPFSLAPAVHRKLQFIHAAVRASPAVA